MATVRAKRFEYEVQLGRSGVVDAKGASLEAPAEWAPEHLVLAGLADCSLTSLRYHAHRAGIAVNASAVARGVVTKREEDGRYAFVGLECEIETVFDPPQEGEPLAELIAKAERDCFVGASFRVEPVYTWRVP